MISDDRPETPLARAMRYFNLSPPDVIRAADSIALPLGIEPVSRRQLGRYLSGENEPTADKIFVLTSAIQDLTEEPVTAADLFHIQRGGVGQSTPVSLPPRVRSVARRRSLWGALFSQAGVLPQIWRVLVIQAGAPTAEGGFEQLYEQYFVLLYAIATRGYGVPDGAAEELVHDAFMAFLEHHPHVYNVKGWLSATVRNRCMNWKRDHQRETPLAPGDYETADETAQGNIEYCIRSEEHTSELQS